MITKRLPLRGARSPAPLDPLRAGMPSLDSIHDVIPFRPTPTGPRYLIVRTTEVDSYEVSPAALALRNLLKGKAAPPKTALAAALKRKPAAGDNFTGTDRKAAKLSIAQAMPEQF